MYIKDFCISFVFLKYPVFYSIVLHNLINNLWQLLMISYVTKNGVHQWEEIQNLFRLSISLSWLG